MVSKLFRWLEYFPGVYTFRVLKQLEINNVILTVGCVAIMGDYNDQPKTDTDSKH
jgi:hypothetical protein